MPLLTYSFTNSNFFSMIKNIHIFESDPVPVAIAKLATPTIASMLVTVIYNIVDTFLSVRWVTPTKSPPFPLQHLYSFF